MVTGGVVVINELLEVDFITSDDIEVDTINDVVTYDDVE